MQAPATHISTPGIGASEPLATSQLVCYDICVKTVGIFEAKTHFSALIEAVMAGETVVVTKKGLPVARIVPLEGGAEREFGVARKLFETGAIVVADDFDAPLPAEMLRKLQGK